MHAYLVTVEQADELFVADFVGVNIDTHIALFDIINVLFANELFIDSKAVSMIKGRVQVMFRLFNLVMFSSLCLKMFNHNWVAWTHIKGISFDTLAKEE